jgi:hypothetical protein
MKKTFLIASLLALSGLSGSTQSKHSLEWGPVILLDDDNAGVERLERRGSGYFTVEHSGGRTYAMHVIARHYDANGRKEKEAKFDFKKVSKWAFRPEWERMINLGDRYYFLLKELQTIPRQTNLFAWAFDPETLTLSKEPVLLATVKDADSILSTYHWTIDRTSERLFVLQASSKREEDPEAALVVKAYDRQLALQFERQFPLAPEIAFLAVNGFNLEQGHLVITSRNYERKPSMWRDLPPFRVWYFIVPNAIDPKAKPALQAINLDLPGVLASQSKHVFQGPNEILCYGLYSKSEARWMSGAFFVRYNVRQRQLDAPQLRPFPASIVESADARDERGKRNRPGELPNFSISDLRVRSDGGLQFIAEQTNNFWTSWTMASPLEGGLSMTYSGAQYMFDNIMVYTLYRDASRDWFSLIRKMQIGVGTDREFSFTRSYDVNGTLRILYNDLPKNLALPPAKSPADLRIGDNAVGTVLASVDPRGSVHRELLFTRKEVGGTFAPKQTTYSPDGTIRLIALGKKSYRFGTLRLR